MKKVLLSFLLMLLPILVSATYINGINYNLYSPTKTATVIQAPYSGNVNIPSQVTYSGVTYTIKSIGCEAFRNCNTLISVTIPYGVTSITSLAFYGCSALTSVYIPNSVTEIGINAFKGCSSLASITIPRSVNRIYEGAFEGFRGIFNIQDLAAWCKMSVSLTIFDSNPRLYVNGVKIEHLVIPSGVTSISNNAFSFFSGLTSVTIPNSVKTIGSYAFSGRSGLKTVISEIENPFTINSDVFYGIPSNATLIVPKGKKSAYQSTAGWNQFSNIVEAGGSTTLTDNGINFALKNDGTLEVIGLNAWTTIADILSDVTIGGKTYRVTSIKAWAFEGRSDLQYLSIPWTVTSIGEYAFIDCGSNITVNIADPECWCQMQLGNEHASPLSSAGRVLVHDIETTRIDIPETVTSIGKFTFYQCRKITSLNIPSSVIFIGSSAFEDCTGLTALTLSEGLQSVGGSSFEGCTGLKSLTIPSTVNTIKMNAFKNCKAITDVFCYAQTVPDTDDTAFDGTPIESATLHVPKGCSGAYRAKAPWKNFKNIVEKVDAKVKLSKTKAAIEKGKTLTLKATITPSDLADKSVTWKSSNTKVATVTSKGKVKGVKAGTATITCTSKATGAKATCKVTVGYVKLDQTEVTVKKGKTVTLKAAVYPSTLEDKSVTWESSNTKVATVTSKGKVKGIKAGLAVITCTSNATGLSTTCIVTVKATSGTRSLEGDDDDEVTEIDEVEASAAIKPFDVYDLGGRKVLHQVTSLDGLPDGIYIVNGKKILKK